MLNADEPGLDELRIISGAFERLCTPGMCPDDCEKIRKLLFELVKDGLTTTAELMERAEEILRR